jgi:predicted CopG family antitoxin
MGNSNPNPKLKSKLEVDRINISLRRETYNELRKLGFAAESFDSVIWRLMSRCKEREQEQAVAR